MCRLCPLCRTESYFVIPSHKHVLGREKELLVEAYKTSLSRKPCKHYLAGECPFGTSCFYMHEEDGKKVTHVRVLYKSDEAACAPRKITLSDYL